ncbi:MAG: hypothetical protein JXA14_11040 [Anaerolineae bacterium]|nr:hypothetical protein [Anaerolineae bacterium]
MFDPMVAQSEIERRYEFVSEGTRNARWLRRLARNGFHIWGNRLARFAGKALIAAGTRLEQRQQLDSAHI